MQLIVMLLGVSPLPTLHHINQVATMQKLHTMKFLLQVNVLSAASISTELSHVYCCYDA
jgi:hypothetical protein